MYYEKSSSPSYRVPVEFDPMQSVKKAANLLMKAPVLITAYQAMAVVDFKQEEAPTSLTVQMMGIWRQFHKQQQEQEACVFANVPVVDGENLYQDISPVTSQSTLGSASSYNTGSRGYL